MEQTKEQYIAGYWRGKASVQSKVETDPNVLMAMMLMVGVLGLMAVVYWKFTLFISAVIVISFMIKRLIKQ